MKVVIAFIFGLIGANIPVRADILVAAAGPIPGQLASLGEQLLLGLRQAVAIYRWSKGDYAQIGE